MLLLAFGLADRMNTMRAEKLEAERQALAAQAALTTELESLVQRRTRALESANQRLAAMAITDELTGCTTGGISTAFCKPRWRGTSGITVPCVVHARHR